MRFPILILTWLVPSLLGAQAAPGTFTLRPGDRIELRGLRDSTLRGWFAVDESAHVVLPLIGRRAVGHAPWTALHDSLNRELLGQLADSGLTIVPYRRVYVLGFVQEPGLHYVDPTTPLLGAVALAGGASPEGSLENIRVVRDGRVLFASVSAGDPRILADAQSGDQIYLERRGWFDRNASFFVSGLVGLAGIVVTLIVAR
jgi:protein involved in polysaccharide export with SLBB domain